MKKLFFIPILGLAIFSFACGSSGAPTDYDSTVQQNYIDGCTEGLQANPQYRNVQAVCGCAYNDISLQIPFDDFEELNSELLEDIDKLSSQNSSDETLNRVRNIVEDCITECGLSSSTSSSRCRTAEDLITA